MLCLSDLLRAHCVRPRASPPPLPPLLASGAQVLPLEPLEKAPLVAISIYLSIYPRFGWRRGCLRKKIAALAMAIAILGALR